MDPNANNLVNAATSIYWTCGLVASGSIGMAGLIVFVMKWMANRMDIKDTFIRETMATVINNNSIALTKCADAMYSCTVNQTSQIFHDTNVRKHDEFVAKQDQAISQAAEKHSP